MNGGAQLAHFQDDFVAALRDPTAASDPAAASRLAAQPGFAVYRNTVAKGCIDALQANYPAVARLVGVEWFRAAAAIFTRGSPPREASLLDYGAGFANFLATFEPAAELPYLPDVATLDRLWTECHLAADQPALVPARLAQMNPASLQDAVLSVHSTARWRWFERHPALSIWRLNRDEHQVQGSDAAAEPDALQAAQERDTSLAQWRAQGVLLARPWDAVQASALTRTDCIFLDACAGRATLACAAGQALASDEGVDLEDMMARLLRAGAFTDIRFA